MANVLLGGRQADSVDSADALLFKYLTYTRPCRSRRTDTSIRRKTVLTVSRKLLANNSPSILTHIFVTITVIRFIIERRKHRNRFNQHFFFIERQLRRHFCLLCQHQPVRVA